MTFGEPLGVFLAMSFSKKWSRQCQGGPTDHRRPAHRRTQSKNSGNIDLQDQMVVFHAIRNPTSRDVGIFGSGMPIGFASFWAEAL